MDSILNESNRWDPDTPHAGVAWIGYAPPHWNQLSSFGPARKGAESLAQFISGTTHQKVTVIGHSYGGVVAALTARTSSQVDRIILAGAPGAPLVADQQAATTYVVTASHDPVPPLRWFNGKNRDPVPRIALQGPNARMNRGHNHYFEPGSAAARAMGVIAAGGTTPTVTPEGESKDLWDNLTSFLLRFAPNLPNESASTTRT